MPTVSLSRGLTLLLAIVIGTKLVRAESAAASKAPAVASPAVPAKTETDNKPLPKGTAKELHQARRSGWLAISQVVPALEAGDAKEFPGGAAWLADFRRVTKGIDPDADPAAWPMIDVDALVTNNAHYWRAYYEVAPGDPAMTLLHSGLLYLGCEPQKGSYLMTIGLQRPGIPAPVREIMEIMVRQSGPAMKESNAAVEEGIKLHDQGKYAEALKKYEAALALCPQNGHAHYEWGLTFRQQKWAAAGLAVEAKPGKIIVDDKRRLTPAEAAAAFAKARRHDPFQWHAYQGDDKEVVNSLRPFLDKGMRNWEKITKAHPKLVEDPVIAGLSEGLQVGQCHDLALVTRQIVVARRGGYAPEDHPFLTTSLRKLAPGDDTEEVLKRLGGFALKFRQLIAPEATAK
jgi:tetratricopeptide (TPR) repeat protein